jgi:hypothetical protein
MQFGDGYYNNRACWVLLHMSDVGMENQTWKLYWNIDWEDKIIYLNRGTKANIVCTSTTVHRLYVFDDDQWRYSPDRALASLTGFVTAYSTMWSYQLHDRPVLDTLIQPSEISSSNY